MHKKLKLTKENLKDVTELSKKILDFVNKYCEEKGIEEICGITALEILLVSIAIANDAKVADLLMNIISCHIFVSSNMEDYKELL